MAAEGGVIDDSSGWRPGAIWYLSPTVQSRVSAVVERPDIGKVHITCVLVHKHGTSGAVFGIGDSLEWSLDHSEVRNRPEGDIIDLAKLIAEPMKISSDQAIALLKRILTENHGNVTQDYLRIYADFDRNNKGASVRQQALDALSDGVPTLVEG